MEARKLLDGASSDLETRKIMRQAFDEAWVVITLQAGDKPLPEDCRVSLAHAVIAHARDKDVNELRAAALAAILPTLR